MAPRSTRPTIELVAQLSKTSKTTVSRYLNGKYEFMSAATKKRIEQVIEELDYHPNTFARSLRSRKSSMIGVIVADISSPFSSILVKGIGDFCNRHDYQTIIVNTDEDPVKERKYLQSFVDEEMVDGIIANITGQNEDLLVSLSHQDRPIVLAERTMNTLMFDTVTNDNFGLTQLALDHQLESGFQQVAFFTQSTDMSSTRRTRLQAYQAYCQERPGIVPYVYVVDLSDHAGIISSIKDFVLKTQGLRRSIFAVNGVTSLALLQGIAAINLKIPDDIGFCGFDDWAWAGLIGPGITTIQHPSYDVGAEAARRLIARIQGLREEPALIQLPSRLCIRGSTDVSLSHQNRLLAHKSL